MNSSYSFPVDIPTQCISHALQLLRLCYYFLKSSLTLLFN